MLRKANSDRAVSFAQVWLNQMQYLEKYAGHTYKIYTVHQLTEDDNWTLVESGDLQDAETGRQQRAQAKAVAKTNDTDTATPTGKSKATSRKKPAKDATAGRLPTSFGYERLQRPRKTLSPLKQRIAEATRLAKEQLANRQEKGGMR